jgi:flagellar biosynthesis protein FliP
MRQKGDLKMVMLRWRPVAILIYCFVVSHIHEAFQIG